MALTNAKDLPKPVAGVKPANGTPQSEETRAMKFRRLANMRVPVAIKKIRHVSNLAMRSQYEYTEEQAMKIFELLDAEVKALKTRFYATGKANAVTSIF
jgi:hypothetical protein